MQRERKERITKREWYDRGGFANPALFRKQSRGGATSRWITTTTAARRQIPGVRTMNRNEYMNGDKLTNGEYDARKGADLHASYFSQFVNSAVIDTVLFHIGKDKLLGSRCYHLNDVPLNLWDNLPMTSHIVAKAREYGDNTSLSTKVCVYKQAARMWLAKHSPAKVWPARYRYPRTPGDDPKAQRWINGYAIGEDAESALLNYRAINSHGPINHEITGESVA